MDYKNSTFLETFILPSDKGNEERVIADNQEIESQDTTRGLTS